MKFVKKILLFLLVIFIIIFGIFYANGKKLYENKLSEISLEDKISSIKSDSNFISLDSLPDDYKNAVVAVEDHRYYSHGAIDVIALARAVVNNIRQKDFKEGGSTITQQTAKNLYFIAEDDIISRKSAEIILSFNLEKNYTKDDILELYVNTIYFGDGYYGIKEACNGYLNKNPEDMTLYDSTMLAGIPNAPSLYAPTVNFNLTQSRQRKVVSSMLEYEYISQEQADTLYSQIDNSTFSSSN